MQKILVSLSILIACLFVVASPVVAKVMIQEKGSLNVAKNEVINDDLFIGSETVEILGTINGDVFVGAGVANIEGMINGDLIIGSGNVTLSGVIRDDVYLGAGNVVITEAKIGGSLTAGAGTLQIDERSTIGGSLIAGVGTINNKAAVARNVMLGAGSIILDSKTNGEVRMAAGDITLGEKTNIGGDVYYIMDDDNRDLVIPATAAISGEVIKTQGSLNVQNNINKSKEEFGKFRNNAHKGLAVISYLGALVVGFIWIKLRGVSATNFAESISKSFAANLLLGFAILIFTVPFALLLMITVIGIPLSILILVVYGLSIYFAKIVVGLWIGSYLAKIAGWNKLNIYLVFALGLLIVYFLKWIPVFGFFVGLMVISLGLGSIFSQVKSPKV